MSRPPRDPKRPPMTYALFMRKGLVSLIIVAGALWLFFWEMSMAGETVAEARTAVVNVVVLVEMAYLFSCRSLNHSIFSIGWFTNRWAIAGSLAMLGAQLLPSPPSNWKNGFASVATGMRMSARSEPTGR
jgi:cation-transporting ATPase F